MIYIGAYYLGFNNHGSISPRAMDVYLEAQQPTLPNKCYDNV